MPFCYLDPLTLKKIRTDLPLQTLQEAARVHLRYMLSDAECPCVDCEGMRKYFVAKKRKPCYYCHKVAGIWSEHRHRRCRNETHCSSCGLVGQCSPKYLPVGVTCQSQLEEYTRQQMEKEAREFSLFMHKIRDIEFQIRAGTYQFPVREDDDESDDDEGVILILNGKTAEGVPVAELGYIV